MNVMNLRDYNSILDYVDNKDRREELNEEELNAFNVGLFYYSVWGDEECAYAALQSMIDHGNVVRSAYEAPQTEYVGQCHQAGYACEGDDREYRDGQQRGRLLR